MELRTSDDIIICDSLKVTGKVSGQSNMEEVCILIESFWLMYRRKIL
jgi:hypothetical protein